MGIVGEMLDDAVGAALDNNELEEETDEEVNKVLQEVLAGRKRKSKLIGFFNSDFLGKVGELPSVVIPDRVIADVESEEDEFDKRLQALKS